MGNHPDETQLDKFKDLARELEADEDDEGRFEGRLRRIVKSQEKADGPRKKDERTPEKGG